ncbi:HPP family protein [Candidatus Thiothrix phosphatis]
MKGGGKCPPLADIRQVAIAWLGGVFAIAVVAWLADASHLPLVLGSFGASCVLLFGFPDSPFSQPRNVIAGHFLASLTGLVFLALFGAHWWSMALATGTAIALMQLTGTVHPPAGSNPVIVMLSAPAWKFLLTPTLIGAVVLVMMAVVFNNLPKERTYPKYWI